MADANALQLSIGPLIGMNDTLNLSAQDGQRASYLENVYSPAGAIGGDVISRPGYTRVSFAPYAATGTITMVGPGNGAAITGVSTLFTSQLSVGDLITLSGGATAQIETISSDTAATGKTSAAVGAGQTFIITPAGISGGQILGEFQHTLTTGVYHRFFLVTTTATALLNAGTTGTFRFLNAGSVAIRLVEWMPSATAPYQVLVDRTSTSMNSVLLDTTQRIYGVTFANYFVITDGTNRPRKIDSSFVLTNCTDANYAFQGPLVVYYGKLMGIDASDKITLRWSEEGDPDTGYGTGTSDNSWSLRQTSSDGLQGLAPTNDALYCFRQSSVAIITGAANSDFRSSGTVDAIQNIGSLAPDSLLVINASVVFRDQYGRPGRIQPGYGYVPLWKRIQEQLRGIGQTSALHMASWGRYDPVKNTVHFAYRTTTSATTNDLMLVFDADSWECLGVHKVYASSAYAVMDHAYGAVLLDQNVSARLTIASGTTADCAFYVQQLEDVQANSALDVTNGGSVTIAVRIRPPKTGGDVVQEKTFQRVVVGTRNVGGTTAGITKWLCAHMGPYDTAFSTPKAMLYGGSTTVPATMSAAGACVKAEQPNVNTNGRYCQFEFTNDTTGNPATRATFDTLTVFAEVNDTDYTRR